MNSSSAIQHDHCDGKELLKSSSMNNHETITERLQMKIKVEVIDSDSDDDVIILDPPPVQIKVKTEPLFSYERINENRYNKTGPGRKKNETFPNNVSVADESTRLNQADGASASVNINSNIEKMIEQTRKRIKTEPSDNCIQTNTIFNNSSVTVKSERFSPDLTNNEQNNEENKVIEQPSKKIKVETDTAHDLNQESIANNSSIHTSSLKNGVSRGQEDAEMIKTVEVKKEPDIYSFWECTPSIPAKQAEKVAYDFSKYLDLNVKLNYDELNAILIYIGSGGDDDDSFTSFYVKNNITELIKIIDKRSKDEINYNYERNIDMNINNINSDSTHQQILPIDDSADNRQMSVTSGKIGGLNNNSKCFLIPTKNSDTSSPTSRYPNILNGKNTTTSENMSAKLQINCNGLQNMSSVASDLVQKSASSELLETSNIATLSEPPNFSDANSVENTSISRPPDAANSQKVHTQSILNLLDALDIPSILENISSLDSAQVPSNPLAKSTEAIPRQNEYEPIRKKLKMNPTYPVSNENTSDDNYTINFDMNSGSHAEMNTCLRNVSEEKQSLPSSDLVSELKNPQTYQPISSSNCVRGLHSSLNKENLHTPETQVIRAKQLSANDNHVSCEQGLNRQSISTSANTYNFASTCNTTIISGISASSQNSQPLQNISTSLCTSPFISSSRSTETNYPDKTTQSATCPQSVHIVTTTCMTRPSQIANTRALSRPTLDSPLRNSVDQVKCSSELPHSGNDSSTASTKSTEAKNTCTSFHWKNSKNLTLEKLRKAIGKKIIRTSDVPFLILEWNGDWLRIQTLNSPPPISDSYFPVRDCYDSFEEYYNTYLPLHLLNIWYNIYDKWRENSDFFHFTCTMELQEEKIHYVRCTCSTVIHNSNYEDCPKRDGIVLITTMNEGRIETMFGYVIDILQKPYNPCGVLKKPYTHKKIKFIFHTTAVLYSKKFDILTLCNLRVLLKQIEALKSVRDSDMKATILNPKRHASSIISMRFQTDKNLFCECIERITYFIRSSEIHVILVEMFSKVLYPLTITKLLGGIVEQNSIVMVCVKSYDKFLRLAKVLDKYNLLLAVKVTEVNVPEQFKKYTVPDRVDGTNITLDKKSEMLKQCQVILTILNNIYLDNIGEVFSHRKLTCIIDDAQLCTETETILPLLYNVNKLVLLLNDVDNVAVSDFLKKYDFHKSLYRRLAKAFS